MDLGEMRTIATDHVRAEPANVPPPAVELHWWPCARPILPVELSRLKPVGEAMLRARVPQPLPGALATAEMLLEWVTSRWRHSGTMHVRSPDANLVLDRVQAGERFACVEYTIVLAQALNALRIPARRLDLLRAGYHAGTGTAHAVTEAWIDDLGKWVLLDSQNGATWRDHDGVPLGALELQQRYQAEDRPEFSGTGPNFSADDADEWFRYFHTVAVKDGIAWSSGSYVPVMEGGTVLTSSRLSDTDVDAAPDLAAISTSVIDRHGPALVFHADHPYAASFALTGETTTRTLRLDEPLPLAGEPGDHRLTIAITTPYASLTPHHLHYTIS